MPKLSDYGPAVLGKDEFNRVQRIAALGADIYGPAVTGPPEPLEEPPHAPSYLSIRALRTALAAEPNKLDFYLAAEWEREGGPRKSGLQLFLELEGKKDAPRQVLLDRLVDALSE